MSKRNPKDVQLAEAIAPTTRGDYSKFWNLAQNRELLEFTMGKSEYENALANCFPHMQRGAALQYCDTLLSLFK